MLIKLIKNNKIILNHLKSKLLLNNFYSFNLVNSIQLQLNLRKLKSFNESIILEGLFLLELLTGLKTSINYFKKMYQQVNIQFLTHLRKQYIFYFIYLLKIFYFPILNRRNESLNFKFDKRFNYNITFKNINIFPFIPNIFFKWNVPISGYFNFNDSNYIKSILFLKYWNFKANAIN